MLAFIICIETKCKLEFITGIEAKVMTTISQMLREEIAFNGC